MNHPPYLGGQGRTVGEIQRDATAIVLTLLACLSILALAFALSSGPDPWTPPADPDPMFSETRGK